MGAGSRQSSGENQSLFAFDQCQAYQLPNGSFLVRNPRNGEHGMLTAAVLSAMDDCGVFRTMDQHVEHLHGSNPHLKGQAADIRKVLESVRKDGLTIDAAEVCANLQVNKAAVPQTDIPVVAILTWERPEALERLLDSICANSEIARVGSCYVIDDSRRGENIARNEAIVESRKADGWSSLVYLGAGQMSDILEKLLVQLPGHERGIRYLFDRAKWAEYLSAGVARNYALLVSMGKRLIMFDDDSISDVYERESVEPGIGLGNVQREVDFFNGPADWQRYRAQADHDPVKRHAQCLGMNLGDALGVLKLDSVKESDLSGSRPESVASICKDSPVLVSGCGYIGDPGTATNRWLAKVSATTRHRLLSSDDKLKTALTARQVWLGRERLQVMTRFNMSPVTGVDNRVSLPPYVPVFRGQDAQFGEMLEFIFPGSVCLDHPWAVQHVPLEDRRWKLEETDFFFNKEFPFFFDNYIQWQNNFCFADDPAARMAHLGRAFIELAGRPRHSIIELYKDTCIDSQARHMQTLSRTLSDSEGTPELWRRLIDEAIAQAGNDIMQLMSDEGLAGYPDHLADDELLDFWREFWGDLGTSLLAWPEIRQAAPLVMDQCDIG